MANPLHSLSLRTLALALALPASAWATPGGGTLHVPAQHPTIQAAIDAALPGDVIVLADGVYRGAGNRDIDFHGKAITVTSANGAAQCVVDCDSQPNAPHRGFLFESGETRTSILQGITIENGATDQGAILDPFNGGAVRILDASPTLRDCVFQNNSAACWGGGVYAGHGGTPLVQRCLFADNSADDGGGFFSWLGARTELDSCVFVGNTALSAGSAVAEFGGGDITIKHCTMVANSAPFATIVDFGTGISIESSIVWGNASTTPVYNSWSTTVHHSLIEGGFAGTGNLDADPLFVAAAQRDFRLSAGSPCVEAGAPAGGSTGLDLRGFPRRLDGDLDGTARVDMGAHELAHGEMFATPSPLMPGVVNLALIGAPSMDGMVVIGTQPTELPVGALGALLFDPTAPWVVAAPAGSMPIYATAPTSNLPSGLTLIFQGVAFDQSGSGNLTNAVTFTTR